MNKINSLIAILFSAIPLWASNTITYTATEKLQGENGRLDIGATTFGPAIISHEFTEGVGTIVCKGEITIIGENAFDLCRGLTSVTIPNSVTTIGNSSFSSCTGLTSVTIPNSVTTIGNYAFDNCSSLTSIEIPNSVTMIGDRAFYHCSGLTSIEIPNSVTMIGDRAFYHCSGLTSINVDTANTHYSAVDDVLFNYTKDTLIQYPIGNTRTEYEIPNSVTTIGFSAFTWCNNLTSVAIPNSVTTIGNYAFDNCSSLTSIEIPNSVKTIGGYAFDGCSGLTSIEIPNSVTTIGRDAFYGCSGLTSVTIPNSVTTIEWAAFAYCSSLTSVTIGNSVTSIGDYTFLDCRGLTSVTIGNSVTTIGDWAFKNCVGLQSITCEAMTPPQAKEDTVFFDCDYSIPLYVPAGSKEAYQTAPEWRKFTNIYDIISSVDSITTTTAVIKWQKVDSAVSYTLSVIETESADTIARYEIDSTGNIIKELRSLPHYVPQRVLDTTVSTTEVFEVSLTNLSSGTTYTYSIDAKDVESTIINSSAGSFTTKSETAINVIKEERPAYHRPINILGQPIDPQTHRGIYIQNGKKYLNSW